MAYKVSNNAFSTLAGAINSIVTSLTVGTGHGDRFPVITGADHTFVTLEDASGNIEIVKVTARASASDVMTIVRAQDGTTARSWAAGDVVECRIIASLLNDAIAHLSDTSDAHAASAITNTPAGNIAATTVQAALNELDTELSAGIATANSNLTAHLNDTSDAHDASAISYAGGTGMSATDVEAAIDELANEKAAIGANGDITSLTACTSITAGTVTVATGDLVYVQDVSAANVLKVVTAQSIANLASAATISSSGIVELITTAELQTGTDTTRAVTADAIRQGLIVSGTPIATTSGTSHDFTSIPSWVKRITLMFNGVSTNGTSLPIVQIGDSGGIEATSYNGAASGITSAVATENHSTGFKLSVAGIASASNIFTGQLTLSLMDSSTNTWAISGSLGLTSSASSVLVSGTKALSAALDRVRLTTVNGTDAFDAGSFNIYYE